MNGGCSYIRLYGISIRKTTVELVINFLLLLDNYEGGSKVILLDDVCHVGFQLIFHETIFTSNSLLILIW